MRIVVLDSYTLNPGDLSWDGLAALGEIRMYDRTPPELVIERIGDAEAVYTNKIPITEEILAACPSIKFIAVTATGFNIIDLDACSRRGIPVCNVPTYGTDSVAQFAFALILEICSRVAHHSDAVHAGRWGKSPDWTFWDYPLIELKGKTMGIIGFGRIGQASGRLARAFGMEVLANDSYPNDSGREIAEYVDLDTLFAQSDIIALHCPLLPSTEGIICAKNIAKMKDGVIIINNGRGPLVVDKDLADALCSGKVYGAGLDVISHEPIDDDDPLLKAPNCYITPHISWAPIESRQRLMDVAVDNLRQFIAGKPINVVNKL